jgi:uncharacterized membrane protein
LLDRYQVEYVYIGPLERRTFPQGPSLDKFGHYWQLVYESEDRQVQIYQRTGPRAGR